MSRIEEASPTSQMDSLKIFGGIGQKEIELMDFLSHGLPEDLLKHFKSNHGIWKGETYLKRPFVLAKNQDVIKKCKDSKNTLSAFDIAVEFLSQPSTPHNGPLVKSKAIEAYLKGLQFGNSYRTWVGESEPFAFVLPGNLSFTTGTTGEVFINFEGTKVKTTLWLPPYYHELHPSLSYHVTDRRPSSKHDLLYSFCTSIRPLGYDEEDRQFRAQDIQCFYTENGTSEKT